MDNVNKSGLESYLDKIAFRALITGIPYVGSPIDMIISNSGQKIKQKKLERTLNTLKEEIERIDKSKMDMSFFDPNNEHFYDILGRMFDYAIKTRDILKIKWYCKVLIGSAIIDNVDKREYAESFLDIISELTPSDLQLARAFYLKQKNIPDSDFGIIHRELRFARDNGWFEIKQSYSDKLESTFKLSLNRLCHLNLIKEIGGSGSENPDGVCIITPQFKRLMEFIEYDMNNYVW